MTDSDKLRRALEEHAEKRASAKYQTRQNHKFEAAISGGAPYREMIVSLVESLNEIREFRTRHSEDGFRITAPMAAAEALAKLKSELEIK